MYIVIKSEGIGIRRWVVGFFELFLYIFVVMVSFSREGWSRYYYYRLVCDKREKLK